MNKINFSRLFQNNSGISFPVLIELSHPKYDIPWFFTSNNVDVKWNDNWYRAVPMSYNFPSSRDNVPQGGTLEIDLDIQYDNYEILRWFDGIDDRASIKVVGLINEEGDITPISNITQRHGTVTWNGEKIVWNLGVDYKMNMQVNPWKFDADALTGYEDKNR